MSWSISDLRVLLAPWNMFKHSSKMIFTNRSKAVLLLWILFVIYVSRLSLFYRFECSLQPCDHLLGKGWPIGSFVYEVSLSFCYFPIWCLGSGVVLYCIDSWSVTSLLLYVLGSQNEFTWQEMYMLAVSLYLHAQIQLRCTGGQDPHQTITKL